MTPVMTVLRGGNCFDKDQLGEITESGIASSASAKLIYKRFYSNVILPLYPNWV